MFQVDLNCDLGESFGTYKIGNDEAIMPHISSANIACGFHAGDPLTMEKTILMALQHGVAIGAHPGYPDLVGFGRRNMQIAPEEVKAIVKFQVAALKGMTEAHGGKLQHVKPHGALYNQAAKDPRLAEAIAQAIAAIDDRIIFVGLANSEMQQVAIKYQLQFASEVFADRAYTNEGHLVPRSMDGAVIHDVQQCKSRVLDMVVQSKATSIDNETISIQADTICIHGDNPAAIELAKELRQHLEMNQIAIKALQ
ncbi:LamB/YcsF family protein [Prolixibacteraceae bacterium JC049]|nr:LamB/YcsF family protein [Prolixibacteraceae bacterium JC049]